MHDGTASLPANINDERYLLGESHNVFAGNVLQRTGTDVMVGQQISAQYTVEVISNIKGNFKGTITVAQMGVGGKTPSGRFSALFGDTDYLHPGATYLLATRYIPSSNVYGIDVPPYDRKLLTEDASLGNEQLKALAEKDSNFIALQNAYPNEKLIWMDIKNNETWNSYASRHYDASGALIDDTVPPTQQQAVSAPANIPVASAAPSGTPTSNVASPTPSTDVAAPTAVPATDSPTPTPIDSAVPTTS